MITRDFLVTGSFTGGYAPKLESPALQPVFAGANIAVRRAALVEIGGFDNACGTREDADFSLRAAKTPWLIFNDERAVVKHRFRTTLRGMLRQWFDYGYFHAYVLRKHSRPRVEVFAHAGAGAGGGMTGLRIPFPVRVFVALSVFHIFHASALVGLLAAFAGWPVVSGGAAILALVSGLKYVFSPLPRRDFGAWLAFLGLRYLMNWVFVLGGFIGGLRVGILNIEPTHDRNAPA